MYVQTYVCMHGCVYVCKYLIKYVSMYMFMFVCTYLCMRMCICIHTHRLCTHELVFLLFVRLCMYIQLSVHMYLHFTIHPFIWVPVHAFSLVITCGVSLFRVWLWEHFVPRCSRALNLWRFACIVVLGFRVSEFFRAERGCVMKGIGIHPFFKPLSPKPWSERYINREGLGFRV